MGRLHAWFAAALAAGLLLHAGTMGRSRFGRQVRAGTRAGQAPAADLLARALDADGDGVISSGEIDRAPAALRSLDRNSDGQLSGDELAAPPPSVAVRSAVTAATAQRQNEAIASFIRPPLPKGPAEKKVLDTLDAIAQRWGLLRMNVLPEDGRLLRLLAEATGAKRAVEIGSAFGYSSLWLALAMEATGGKLITHEINVDRIDVARQYFKEAGVEPLVTLVEGDAHDEVLNLKGPIDLLFIDADKSGYLDYLDKLLPLVRPGGLIIAHNTRSHADKMTDYLKAITSRPELDTVFLNMHGPGLSVTLKKR